MSAKPPYGMTTLQFAYHIGRIASSYACLLGDTSDLMFIANIMQSLSQDVRPLRLAGFVDAPIEPAVRESSEAMQSIQQHKGVREPAQVIKRVAISGLFS